MRGIDRFGSLYRPAGWDYLDLTLSDVPVVPAVTAAAQHEHRGPSGHLARTAFTVAAAGFGSATEVEGFLRLPGLHAVMFCARTPGTGRLVLLSHRFMPTSPEARFPLRPPRPFVEWLEPGPDPRDFPGSCPDCGGPAYVGLNLVECAGGCPRRGGR